MEQEYKNIKMQLGTDCKRDEKIMYISEPKTKYTPDYVYHLLEYYECELVSFNTSLKIFIKDDLKGKESWNGIKPR